MHNFNINTAGFIIVGMFIVTWAAAMLIWRYGHIEEKWSARLMGRSPKGIPVAAVGSRVSRKRLSLLGHGPGLRQERPGGERAGFRSGRLRLPSR